MPEKPVHKDELERIMEQLVTSVLEASDEELVGEMQASGEDSDAIAVEVKAVTDGALNKYGRRRRQEASTDYKRRVKGLSERQYVLPTGRRARLDLLAAAFAARPNLNTLVTVAHRDLRELSDSDLESLLHQLGEIGMLAGKRDDSENE